MLESLLGVIAIVALFIIISKQQSRLGLLERELGALRSLVLSGAVPAPAAKAAEVGVETVSEAALPEATAAEMADQPTVAEAVTAAAASPEAAPAEELPVAANAEADATSSGPWSGAPAAAEPAQAAARATPDIETALGTRWAVWVGGLALAFGAVFLIRYSIESGIFGPGLRLSMAALLGLVLVGGGEFIRRTGYRVPIQNGGNAYIPAILTAAGAFTLFGAIYAAHGIYGFIGAGPAFGLLGIVGVATIAAALAHGQALAGLGLLGSMVTPVLVASTAPNYWALFGYLAIVLVATTAVARTRRWSLLMGAAFIGTGLWTLLYLADAPLASFTIVLFISAVTLAALALLWLGRDDDPAALDWPSMVPAFFVAVTAIVLFIHPTYASLGGPLRGAVLLLGMLAVALYRPAALSLLFAAGIAAVLVYLRNALGGTFDLDLPIGALTVEGLPIEVAGSSLTPIGWLLGLVFAGAGLWNARRQVVAAPWRAASWAGWGVAVPLAVLFSLWLAYGNPDRDLLRALLAVVMVAAFVAGGEWIARGEQPPLTGGPAVSFAFGGAGVALLLALHMGFGSGWTTVLLGVAAALPALATRQRLYPVLGWLSVAAAIAVLARIAFDPTIVGADVLGRTPVFNWLLPGYGIPALAFGFAAWQLARTTNGRPRLVMEAVAALFALLTLAMLVRHAMNGGVITSDVPTLAEQAIYTLIALGGGAMLVALDMRSPSPVLRYGSLGIGVVSVLSIVGQHFLVLNPLFTNESTGGIPFFNLLFLAYLLPAAAAAGLALYARNKRPQWYSAMLALVAALLVFAYATLSVRRLFQGEHIGLWAGLGQVETYSYSALWLAMGVGLLVAGVTLKSQILRIASAALISIAVAKVFLFDMSELEGVLRALSFIGLGGVLIGIGLFYQRLLTRAAR
ncbi:putative membrane protein [Aminobacter aminovorans]|uniref:Predicted membrane protein n=1 Tax=Aminobacter aminovorans TaxID=83263 RepID=A0A380WQ84_AMIAI|nr:DUF2339 domain-containing protein [Aminobacter aminovorans]TCS30116.1 putative membrane protein [Aminobacter aminovorans]SUU90965.1 Predicted membrane protein [Aminobacter aminovorans]